MTLYRCEIHKFANGKKFANDYLIESAEAASAGAIAQEWAAFERSMMGTMVAFQDIRVSTVLKGDRAGIHIPLNFQGTGRPTAGNALPAFCTLRLDFATPSLDTGHKYYRYVLTNDEQANDIISPDVMVTFNTNLTTSLGGNPDMLGSLRIGKHDYVVLGATWHNLVQERQERRRRKKKAVVTGGTGV